MSQPRPTVLGVQITPGTHDELLQSIREHIAAGSGVLHVVTANPEYVMTARRDPAFKAAINQAGISTVDGAGLAIAMRLLHPSVPIERYTGVALTPDVMALSQQTGASVFFLGAGPGVAAEAARRLQQQYPGAIVDGCWADGSPRPEHDAETIRRIADSGASILLVAYGAPSQITWIQRNLSVLEGVGVLVVAGIGGAFDYISGNVKYAPPMVRKFGLEWLYRLLREPWRWRRQLVLPQFALLVLIEVARSRWRGRVE